MNEDFSIKLNALLDDLIEVAEYSKENEANRKLLYVPERLSGLRESAKELKGMLDKKKEEK